MYIKMANMNIISGDKFNPETNIKFTKPKINERGGKSIGIINSMDNKALYLSTPLMLTWGINKWTDEQTGRETYDMSLQFPSEEYTNNNINEFLNNIKKLEQHIKSSALQNSKDWFGKAKMSSELVDALFTPILKYPKDKGTGEPDLTKNPTFKIKIPFWEGECKSEIYNIDID